jgi:hypothetical protein
MASHLILLELSNFFYEIRHRQLKIKLLKTVIFPTVLYGCELGLSC